MAYTGTVEVRGLNEMIGKIQLLEREMRREPNTELRWGAKNIALGVLAQRHRFLGGGGTPQEWGIVEATYAKYDRYVALQVPGAKPKSRSGSGVMRGLRKTPAARARSLAIAVEWGSSWPGLCGPSRGALVGRNVGRITRYVADDYSALVAYVLRKYGLL